MEREWQSAMIISTFFILSLIGAVVLFYFLESYAEVTNTTYRLGGAAAGFFVFFVTLVGAYSRIVAKPSSKLMRETGQAFSKPKGFRKCELIENGFSIYYPKEWQLQRTDNFPQIVYNAEDGETVLILTTQTMNKEFVVEFEKDPSQLSSQIEYFYAKVLSSYTIVNKDTIALHGKQFPVFFAEKVIDVTHCKYMIIFYVDTKAEKIHILVFGSTSETFKEKENIFKRILSTFQPLE